MSAAIKREISQHALAAKAIRAELKKAFPKTKFSVESQSYSMGNSVTVYWDYDRGPDASDICHVLRKYQYGHFDGMTDTYEHSNNRDDVPQAKFVMAQHRGN